MRQWRESLWTVRAALLGLVALALLALASASTLGAAHAATIEDASKRQINLPADIKAIVPAGAPAQVLIHALAPEQLVALVEPFKPGHVIYVDPRIAALPQIPVLTRMTKPGDIAMVQGLKAHLVIDYGSTTPRYVEADKKIEATLGVPTLLFGGSLGEASKVVKLIGAVVGAAPRSETLAASIDDLLRRLAPLSSLSDAERVPVYLARGADGLNAARAGTSFDEPIRLAGGRNVVDTGRGTFTRLRVEEVVALKPAVVVFASRDALKSPLHAALPRGTKFLVDAGEPYPVLTGPPSLNRLVGLAALALVLHGDKARLEPEQVTALEGKLFHTRPGLALPAPLQVQP